MAKGLYFFLFILIACSPSFQINPSDNDIEINNNESASSTTNPLMIVAINVGQGDATLIVTPSSQKILIDAGPTESGTQNILPLLASLGIYSLDTIFVSHYDADHIGGLTEVIQGFDEELNTSDDYMPEVIYDRGESKADSNETFENYITIAGNLRQTLAPGELITLEDGVSIQCLIINGQTTNNQMELIEDDENAHSMGLLISYVDFRYLTLGDLPGGGTSGDETTSDLESLISPLLSFVDLYHVSHHGSQTSSSENFLNHIQPTVSLISVGEDNGYGHPHSTVLNHLYEIESEVYQTNLGSGGYLPTAHILNNHIFIFVEEDGSYTVNGNEYQVK